MSAITMIDTSTAPDIGLYENVAAEVYHSWPYASNSRLNLLARSPAHLKAELDDPSEPTPALEIGAAIHCAILEPDSFPTKYVRAPEGDRRTKAVKEAWEALAVEHPFATILSPADYDTCIAVRDSVWKHPAAKMALSDEGKNELSMVWDDPNTGVRCKGRADRINLKLGAVIDIKTTMDARASSFSRDIYNHGYHRQAAMYTTAVEVLLSHEAPSYYFIVAEKKRPHAVSVFLLRDDAIVAGLEQLESLLRRYDECMKSGHWPAYGDMPVEISLPPWAWKQIDAEEERTVGV